MAMKIIIVELKFYIFFQLLFNSTPESLHDLYPVDMLPNEWGGKAGNTEELSGKCFSTVQYLCHLKLLKLFYL